MEVASLQGLIKILAFFTLNFVISRLLINRKVPYPPAIQEVKEEWPILFQTKYLYWHFKKLTNKDVTMIGTYLRDMAQKLIKFGETKQLITAEEASENENKLLKRVMMVISNYFKEPLSSMIFEFEVSNAFSRIYLVLVYM